MSDTFIAISVEIVNHSYNFCISKFHINNGKLAYNM